MTDYDAKLPVILLTYSELGYSTLHSYQTPPIFFEACSLGAEKHPKVSDQSSNCLKNRICFVWSNLWINLPPKLGK